MTLLGFHIRYHCDNILATVDRELEVRVDRARSLVFHHEGTEALGVVGIEQNLHESSW